MVDRQQFLLGAQTGQPGRGLLAGWLFQKFPHLGHCFALAAQLKIKRLQPRLGQQQRRSALDLLRRQKQQVCIQELPLLTVL